MVVRRRTENGQLLLVPRHTVILVSRDDLPLDELVRRHRAKQGHIAQALLRAVQFTALASARSGDFYFGTLGEY